jgi:CRISPR system Cascade subunit CasB
MKLNEEAGVGQAIIDWWTKLEEHDRGGRAQLRRAATVLDALMCPAFQRLQRRLVAIQPELLSSPRKLDRLAMACALMSHVKRPGADSLPKAMSHPKPGQDRNPVSELRFRRLLDAPDDDALFTGLRRALPLIGDGQVNLLCLTEDVLFWGDTVKRNWAYAYVWPTK